jgi:HEAT repeat protein
MVTSLLVSTFAVLLTAPTVTAAPSKAPPAPAPARLAAPASQPPQRPAPAPLDWRARLAISIQALQTEAPDRLAALDQLQPTRSNQVDELSFAQADLHDPRAAAVLLRRILRGSEPVAVRCALVDALPQTGGDWQEGAAALIGIDADPAVRKRLVEAMRYADAPHSVHGLRLGFKDEAPEINIAAARTAGFSRQGPELAAELEASTRAADWDLRAAAVQSLGRLRLPQSREILLKALYDAEREVRLQGLLALEQLDPEGVIYLPEIDRLARDRKSHRIARTAELMLQKRRAAEKAGKPASARVSASAAAPAPASH